AIDSKNLMFIIDVFNSILNECVSSSSKIFDDERSVRDIIYAALIEITSIQQIKERDTAKGKSDLELITAKSCMIIEFKRTYSTRGPEASLNQAIDQIKKNRYGLLFSKTYTIYRVAMVISSEEKKILPNFCREVL
ncbi:MAG: PD-(D/E)XK nuclease domain-containing protein, partial [Desulfovibrionaceae bacterium]|nr:PD-(D/E)XK nuclease domain-containing protein [Desulfovibrionaceae bacterium]